jgi:hypothetical protein
MEPTIRVGDRVRIRESARVDFLSSGEEGLHIEAVRENRVGYICAQVGERERHLVIAFEVDFGDVMMTIPEEDLEKVQEGED